MRKRPLPPDLISWYRDIMTKSTGDTTKPQKPRATITGEPVMVRIQPDMAKRLDDWRRDQSDLPGRPEAVRRLVELGLQKGK